MKRIFDPALLDFYLQKHEIPSLFDTPDLAFSLYQFEKGEDEDIGLVASLLSSIIDETSEFAMAFNTKSKENALSALNKTEGDLKKIEMILSAEIKTREEEALARI